MPDDLVPQIPVIKEVVRGFRMPVLEMEGFEADDIIATLARRFADRGMEVTVVTGDKDLMQVVSERIRLLDTMKEKFTGLEEVRERFGGSPDKVPPCWASSSPNSARAAHHRAFPTNRFRSLPCRAANGIPLSHPTAARWLSLGTERTRTTSISTFR
jgi:hypothetical protein